MPLVMLTVILGPLTNNVWGRAWDFRARRRFCHNNCFFRCCWNNSENTTTTKDIMLRRTIISPPKFWNRKLCVRFARELASDRSAVHLVLGGPSCGKTALMKHALRVDFSKGPWDMAAFCIDFRAVTIDEGPEVCKQHIRAMLKTTAEKWSKISASGDVAAAAAALTGKVFAVTTATIIKTAIDFAKELKAASEAEDVIVGLERAINAASSSCFFSPVIFFDEVNLLQSHGKEKFVWRDQLFAELLALCIRVSKQESRTAVIFATNDQQHGTQFASTVLDGKDFAKVHSLGFLSVDEAHQYLQDPEGGPVVDDEQTRDKIIEVVGGSFLELNTARLASAKDKDGAALDDELDTMKYAIRYDAEMRFRLLRQHQDAAAAGKLITRIAPMLATQGYALRRDVIAEHGVAALDGLLAANLVDVRWRTNSAWSDDLTAARKDHCIAPFSPIGKTWLRDDKFIKDFASNEKK